MQNDLIPMNFVGPLILIVFSIAMVILIIALRTVGGRKYNIEEFYERHPHQSGQGGERLEDDVNTEGRS